MIVDWRAIAYHAASTRGPALSPHPGVAARDKKEAAPEGAARRTGLSRFLWGEVPGDVDDQVGGVGARVVGRLVPDRERPGRGAVDGNDRAVGDDVTGIEVQRRHERARGGRRGG